VRILVISDIHGNLPSLEYVIHKEKSCDLVVSLGDVVNYGPWSNECVDLLQSLEEKVLIMGNHEVAFISGFYPGKNKVTQAFFEQCYPLFGRKNLIDDYVENYSFGNSYFTHTLNDSYVFADSKIEINKNTFIGHSHRMFEKMVSNFRLVNPGSVGQNRVNIDEINYAIWDTEKDIVELVRKNYPAQKMINEMRIKNYPEICIEYILSKRVFLS
jgi:predicted phosphodiesterase